MKYRRIDQVRRDLDAMRKFLSGVDDPDGVARSSLEANYRPARKGVAV